MVYDFCVLSKWPINQLMVHMSLVAWKPYTITGVEPGSPWSGHTELAYNLPGYKCISLKVN